MNKIAILHSSYKDHSKIAYVAVSHMLMNVNEKLKYICLCFF